MTKNIAIGAIDSEEYYTMMPKGACSLGDVITARIQTTTEGGTEQCLCAGSQYSMSVVGLPLQFLTTNAQVNDCAVNLAWIYNITSNSKLAGFVIERSSNGSQYTSVASLNSTANSFVDITPNSGTWLYRIRATNINGEAVYSSTLKVNTNQCIGNSINIYPNPANEQLNVVLQGTSTSNNYQLVDALGRIVLKGDLQANSNNKIDLGSIVQGVYVLKVIIEGTVTIQQVQVRK